jgi:hypothetical protein
MSSPRTQTVALKFRINIDHQQYADECAPQPTQEADRRGSQFARVVQQQNTWRAVRCHAQPATDGAAAQSLEINFRIGLRERRDNV